MRKILIYDLKNLAKIKALWGYFLFLLLGSWSFMYLGGDVGKAVLSLLNVSLIVVPLFSAFFSVTYMYNSRNFIKFLLTQPVTRSSVFWGKFLALSFFFSFLYAVGVSLPLAGGISELEDKGTFVLLLLSGVLITFVFIALATLIAVIVDDRAKGVSLLLALWMYLTILHDGLILSFIYIFRDYPLEGPVIVLSLINPVDMARILVILRLDIASLMGVSGATFKEFLGSAQGMLASLASLIAWITLPLGVAFVKFKSKDL